jgi:hypothetical protein
VRAALAARPVRCCTHDLMCSCMLDRGSKWQHLGGRHRPRYMLAVMVLPCYRSLTGVVAQAAAHRALLEAGAVFKKKLGKEKKCDTPHACQA